MHCIMGVIKVGDGGKGEEVRGGIEYQIHPEHLRDGFLRLA